MRFYNMNPEGKVIYCDRCGRRILTEESRYSITVGNFDRKTCDIDFWNGVENDYCEDCAGQVSDFIKNMPQPAATETGAQTKTIQDYVITEILKNQLNQTEVRR